MNLRRIVVIEEDGTTSVPHARKLGVSEPPGAVHGIEGHVYQRTAMARDGQMYVCTVCGEIFLETSD